MRIAAFDGENADPLNGRTMGEGIKAYTPWGEIAYALAGAAGYERVRPSDEAGVAPGAAMLRELFGGQPTLILLDELSVYLRKFGKKAPSLEAACQQLSAFLTALFKAVEGTPNAAVVYTLAIGKTGKGEYQATDAYSRENLLIAQFMEEADKISARKATVLNPTTENETIAILRRRFFQDINVASAQEVIEVYTALWKQYQDVLPKVANAGFTLYAGNAEHPDLLQWYPFHPELMATLTEKTATLPTFQRVRGMLRLLAKMISRLWAEQPAGTYALHTHHLDLSYGPLYNEALTRWQQSDYAPAVKADIAGGQQSALAQDLDAQFFAGLPPYTTYAARTIFLHSLAFNDHLKGLTREELRYATLGTDLKPEFLDQALDKFVSTSGYLDDTPAAPLCFQTAPNLTNLLRREAQKVDPLVVRAQLNDRISSLFKGSTCNAAPFAYDGDDVPEFLVVDAARKQDMHEQMIRHLALKELQHHEGMAAHQQETVKDLYKILSKN